MQSIVFREKEAKVMYYKKKVGHASALVLGTWPIFLKWFGTAGQLPRGTPCFPWGRIYDFIQDV